MKRFILAGTLALLVPTIAACGNATSTSSKPAAAANAPAAGAQQLTVVGSDTMKFEPATLTVKAGQPVQVTFKNDGQIVHDWTLSNGVSSKAVALAQGKSSGSVVFTIDQPGTYTFICSQPGHEAAGMKGTITVQ